MFRSKWCNIVGTWCVNHFLKYGKPPKRAIETTYQKWVLNKKIDKSIVKTVESFLDALSNEYESKDKESSEFIIDLASHHFNRVAVDRLREELEDSVDEGKIDEAIAKVHSFTRIEMGQSGTINVLADKEAIRRSFETKEDPLITYQGALGKFFGGILERDALVGFVASDKVGKSFWMLDIAWRSLLQRRKVAMFVVGDMSESQVMRRFMARAAGRPLRATKKDRPVRYPRVLLRENEESEASVEYDERQYKKDLDWREAIKLCENIMKNKVKSTQPYLQLKCHASNTISAAGIRSQLDSWSRLGWSPDIIIIDYSDNLAAINSKIEYRHQVTETWQAMRTLSQELHALVVTATQANSAAYSAQLLGKKHFSESKMKNALVTAMIGINQNPDEESKDVCRLNIVAQREEEKSKVVYVAGCRSIANIAVRSCF